MNFTKEKINVLYKILKSFDFSMGFTSYKNDAPTYYSCSKNETYINIDDRPTTFNPLSNEGHLAIFPIVLDYFDAVLDKKLSINNINFCIKKDMIKNIRRGDCEIDFLEEDVYRIASNLRNKIIHNNLTIKTVQNCKTIVLSKNVNYHFDDVRHFNRLVFNVALRCLTTKTYSRFEKCAALAIYKKLTRSINCTKLNNKFSSGILIDTVVYPRALTIFTNVDIKDCTKVLDFIVQKIGDDNIQGSSKPFISDKLFKFEISERTLLIPSELINKNRDATFSDINHWTI
ncbi:hypothetical protein [Aeromonas salmonicida]|uniref:hypothetical protein n=1 Tax=Aeromonas salmonicida TaxID=645 RepID=UPI0012D90979|nr:hypothetical protein [Aeromonas salmonicida]MUG28736.1 hypothetical protein [Aeromonas salmonicida]